MPKTPKPSNPHAARRHNPLAQDYLAPLPPRQKATKQKKRSETRDGHFVDSKASHKILEIGRDLAAEEELQPNRPPAANPAFDFDARPAEDENDEDEREFHDDQAWGDEEDDVEEVVRRQPLHRVLVGLQGALMCELNLGVSLFLSTARSSPTSVLCTAYQRRSWIPEIWPPSRNSYLRTTTLSNGRARRKSRNSLE